jgi:mRNA-degrading endonuclease toxin of MazEF toxin-antitoxin module
VRSFSVERFVEQIGTLEASQMDAIARAVAVVVGAVEVE